MRKNDPTKNQQTETHPLLPSGEWEGFYCYNYSPKQHKMSIELFFANAIVSGSGIDDVASFIWKGKYELKEFKINMTKYYSTHKVTYKGDIDENGIWGVWEIVNDYSGIPSFLVDSIKAALKHTLIGGFHIWPKKSNSESNSNVAEEQNESKKLKKIKIANTLCSSLFFFPPMAQILNIQHKKSFFFNSKTLIT